MQKRREFEQWYEYTMSTYAYSHKDIVWKAWQHQERDKGWLKEQLEYAKEQVKDLPDFKREPFFQSSENIMSNVSNLKKTIIPTATAFDFLLWDTQNYYTIYKDGDPILHCHFQNIDPEGEPMAGIYVMKEGESVFKLDFGIDLMEVTQKDDYELGELLVRLMEGDEYKLSHIHLINDANCNHANNDE